MMFGSFYLQWIVAHILGWLLALSISGMLIPLGFTMWSSLILVTFLLTICQFAIALPIRSNWKYVIIFTMNAIGCFAVLPVAAPIFVVVSGMEGSIAETIMYLTAMGLIYGVFSGAPLAVLISRQNAEDDAFERARKDLMMKQERKRQRAYKRALRLSAVNMARADQLYQFSVLQTAGKSKLGVAEDDFGEDVAPDYMPGPVELVAGDTYDYDIPQIPEAKVRGFFGERLLKPGDEIVEDG